MSEQSRKVSGANRFIVMISVVEIPSNLWRIEGISICSNPKKRIVVSLVITGFVANYSVFQMQSVLGNFLFEEILCAFTFDSQESQLGNLILSP